VNVRVFKVIGGFGLLLAGTVMLFVPGPGWLTIAAGLAMLADEYPWARRALDAVKTRARRWRGGDAKEHLDGHTQGDLARGDGRPRRT
jgi:hypothetical protein